MAHQNRKTQKKRGTRTCGWGGAQKHRGAGSRGGRGMAGSKKHHWSWVSKYRPGYFGGKGFKRPACVSVSPTIINLSNLEKLLPKLVQEGKAEVKKGKTVIDLHALGYDKLLGAGNISSKLSVTVTACSAKAKEKIEAAGGQVILPEGEEIKQAAEQEVEEAPAQEAEVDNE